ncbi:hypothetical protein CLOP_g4121 [Closterium sp. NIES-67]|nr:hypothetical protein CLOP_g4121 [Closterium sp. NIES-67]
MKEWYTKAPPASRPAADGEAEEAGESGAGRRVLMWRDKAVYQVLWKYGMHAIGPLQAVLDKIDLRITHNRVIQPKKDFDQYPASIHRALKRLMEYRQSLPPRPGKAGGSGGPGCWKRRRMQGKWPRRFKETCFFLDAAGVPCPAGWQLQVEAAAAAAAATGGGGGGGGGCVNLRAFKGVMKSQSAAAAATAAGLSVFRVANGGGLKISATLLQLAGSDSKAAQNEARARAGYAGLNPPRVPSSDPNTRPGGRPRKDLAANAASGDPTASKAPAAAPTAHLPRQGLRGMKRKAEGAREEVRRGRRRGGSEEEEQGEEEEQLEPGVGGDGRDDSEGEVVDEGGCGKERGGKGKGGGGRGNEGGGKGKETGSKAKEGGAESKVEPWYCKTKAVSRTRTTVNLAVKATKEKLCEIGERAEEADRQMVEARRALVEKYWGILKAELKKGEQEERRVLAEVAARGEARLARRVACLNRLMDDRLGVKHM